jgi:hypothetical protein
MSIHPCPFSNFITHHQSMDSPTAAASSSLEDNSQWLEDFTNRIWSGFELVIAERCPVPSRCPIFKSNEIIMSDLDVQHLSQSQIWKDVVDSFEGLHVQFFNEYPSSDCTIWKMRFKVNEPINIQSISNPFCRGKLVKLFEMARSHDRKQQNHDWLVNSIRKWTMNFPHFLLRDRQNKKHTYKYWIGSHESNGFDDTDKNEIHELLLDVVNNALENSLILPPGFVLEAKRARFLNDELLSIIVFRNISREANTRFLCGSKVPPVMTNPIVPYNVNHHSSVWIGDT